jgi:hypothetical protein
MLNKKKKKQGGQHRVLSTSTCGCSGISFIDNRESKGPKILPCGIRESSYSPTARWSDSSTEMGYFSFSSFK